VGISNALTEKQQQTIISDLQQKIPGLLAIYLFGSQAKGEADNSSDIDLAVYHSGSLDPVTLWEVGAELANQLDKDVDLVDFNQASTVLQHQILSAEQRLWCKNSQVDGYEATIFNMKTQLDEWRADILQDIKETGRVYS